MLVLEHLNILLYSKDTNAQHNSNLFLTNWQQTVEAWSESHSILYGEYPVEAKLIAAQTIRTKVLYDSYQLSKDSLIKLCESLLSFLSNESLPRSITSTIGLAICDLAIQMVGSWESPIETFINYYKSGKLSLNITLYLLESLPEELMSDKVILTPELYDEVEVKLKSEYRKMLEYLVHVKGNSDNTYISSILKTWHNWKYYSTCINYSFVNDCFHIISNPNLRNQLADDTFEIAVNCIVDILYLNYRNRDEMERTNTTPAVTDVNTDKIVEEVRKKCMELSTVELVQHLINGYGAADVEFYVCMSRLYVALLDSMNGSVERGLLQMLVHFIELPYCLLFISSQLSVVMNPFAPGYNRITARDSHWNHVISNPPTSLDVRFDDETTFISQRSIYLLYDLLNRNESSGDMEFLCKEILDVLVLILTSPLSIITDDYLMSDYEAYLDDVFELLDEILRKVPGNVICDHFQKAIIGHNLYRRNIYFIESSLRIFSVLFSKVRLKRSEKIIDLVNILVPIVADVLKCPQNLPKSTHIVCIRFLGNIRRMLLFENFEGLAVILRMLNDQLSVQDKKVHAEVIESITSVCYYLRLEKCSEVESILTLLLDTLRLSSESLPILEGVGVVISRLEDNLLIKVVSKIIEPWLNDFDSVNVTTLTKLTSLLRSLRNRECLHVLFRDLIPKLFKLLNGVYNDVDLVECICRCIKHLARCISNCFGEYIPIFFNIITTNVNRQLFGTYLYVVEWTYLIYDLTKEIEELYYMLTTLTLKTTHSSLNTNDVEELIEDFYGLQTQFIDTNIIMSRLELLENIIFASTKCFNINKPQCIFSFWQGLIKRGRDNMDVKRIAFKHLGDAIVATFKLLSSGCCKSTKYYIEDFIVLAVDEFGNYLAPLFENALKDLPPNIKNHNMVNSLLSSSNLNTINHIYKSCLQVTMRNRSLKI